MKILFMGVRDDERAAVGSWSAAHPEHDVTTTTDVLTAKTVDTLKGYDTVTVQQVIVPEAEVYPRLRELGITQLSSRTAGVDMYDLERAREYGISVSNVPVYSPNAIAEFALTSALHLTRRFPVILDRMAEQDFRFAGMIGRELATMTVAILGTGSIGLVTARHFRSLGARVIGYDPFPRDEFHEIGQYIDTIEEAVADADLISLHMPAMADNHHLFNADMFARMRRGAILVNCARGALVDSEALLEALNSGQLGGAALDTYENEQRYFRADWRERDLGDPTLEALLNHPAVLVTPHVAFYTDTAVENLVYGGLDNAVEAATRGTCASVMN
ncbi:D-2-hydroxyacid dehydrogenase [Devriesea agamarum]|uniref:D-2-hydroxyacid dehydrogenase n=1 Tax=Devriesea agamarum TaxID=472569 RepID=UPI00071CEB2A|nr:D-2-hydroxyacid dehydrogenase [Devriesea agamarum]